MNRTHPGGSAIPVSTQVPTSAPDSTVSCENCKKLQAQLDEAYAILSHNMKVANNNTKRVRAERDQIIRKLREKHSCIEIADQFGLTRQRVHQILNEAPVEAQ